MDDDEEEDHHQHHLHHHDGNDDHDDDDDIDGNDDDVVVHDHHDDDDDDDDENIHLDGNDKSSRSRMSTIKRMTSSSYHHTITYTKSMDTDSPASYPKHVIIPSPPDSHDSHQHHQHRHQQQQQQQQQQQEQQHYQQYYPNHHRHTLPLVPRPSGSFMEESPTRHKDHDKVVTPILSHESRRQQQYQGGTAAKYGNQFGHPYSGPPMYRPQDVRYPPAASAPAPVLPSTRYDGYNTGHSYYSPNSSEWETSPYYGDTYHQSYPNKFASPTVTTPKLSTTNAATATATATATAAATTTTMTATTTTTGTTATATTPSPLSKRSWSCDYCHVATFPTYEEACLHEEACAARYGIMHRQQPPPSSSSSSTSSYPLSRSNHHHGLGTLFQAASVGTTHHEIPIHHHHHHQQQQQQQQQQHHHHHPYNSNNHRMPPPSTPYTDAYHHHHHNIPPPPPPPPTNHYSPQLPPYRYSHPSGWGNGPPPSMPSERSNYPNYPTLSPQFKDSRHNHYHHHHQQQQQQFHPTSSSSPSAYEDVAVSYGNHHHHHSHHQQQYHHSHPRGILLAMPDDADSLSDRQCYVRAKFVQVFAATEADVASRHSKGAQKLTLGQVGIRCLHCAHLRPKDRAERAICYPSSISRIYQTVADMQRFHFEQCREIPDEVRRIYKSLKTTRPRGVGSPQMYWIQSAKLLNLVDSEDGIFFGTTSPTTTNNKNSSSSSSGGGIGNAPMDSEA
jgi:hypothetical protein